MIDNNDKSSLHNRWNMRILCIYFSNGLKRIFGKISGRVIAIIYLAFCLIFWECRYSIWQPYGYFQNLQKFMTSVLVLILIPSVTFALTFLIGMPFGSIGVSNNLHRIGFVNSAGEAPLLLSKSVDKSNDRVMILKF